MNVVLNTRNKITPDRLSCHQNQSSNQPKNDYDKKKKKKKRKWK